MFHIFTQHIMEVWVFPPFTRHSTRHEGLFPPLKLLPTRHGGVGVFRTCVVEPSVHLVEVAVVIAEPKVEKSLLHFFVQHCEALECAVDIGLHHTNAGDRAVHRCCGANLHISPDTREHTHTHRRTRTSIEVRHHHAVHVGSIVDTRLGFELLHPKPLRTQRRVDPKTSEQQYALSVSVCSKHTRELQ